MQESQIIATPRYLVHPLCLVHERDLTHIEKLKSDNQIYKIWIQSSLSSI